MALSVSLSACASSSTSTTAHSLAAAAGSSTPTQVAATAAPSQSQSVAAAPWCAAAQLALTGPLDGFGGISGEHQLTFALRDTGSRDCSLEGHPTVELYDPRPMLFVYDDARLDGWFLSIAPPTRVILTAHREEVYFQVVKYRCDTGESFFATRLRVTLPNAAGAFTVDLSPPLPPVRSLWWCTGQTHDPGNVVSVSPIRHTANQLGP